MVLIVHDSDPTMGILRAPRGGLERELRKICQSILGRAVTGIYDNWFDLGGTSLQALDLLNRIQSEFGYEVDLADFLQNATIAGLSFLMRCKSSPLAPSCLVPLQKGVADHPPLFCFHPVAGGVAHYFALGRAIGSHQPVFGVQSLGLREGFEPYTTVESMTERYLREIIEAYPVGPYRLTGYSFGGVLALEAANQLARSQKQVDFLALIEPPLTVPTDSSEVFALKTLAEFVLYIPFDEVLYQLEPERALAQIHLEAVKRGVFHAEFPLSKLKQIYLTVTSNIRALKQYSLEGWSGEAIIIHGRTRDSGSDSLYKAYASSARIFKVELPHYMLLETKGAKRIAPIFQDLLK